MFKTSLDKPPKINLNNNESSSYVWLTRKQANRMDDDKQLILDEMPCIERVYQNKDFG